MTTKLLRTARLDVKREEENAAVAMSSAAAYTPTHTRARAHVEQRRLQLQTRKTRSFCMTPKLHVNDANEHQRAYELISGLGGGGGGDLRQSRPPSTAAANYQRATYKRAKQQKKIANARARPQAFSLIIAKFLVKSSVLSGNQLVFEARKPNGHRSRFCKS